MAFLTDADRQRIREAIRAAEHRTCGEFVTVVARASDSYLATPILFAATAALVLPAIAWLIGFRQHPAELYLAQIAILIVVLLLLLWPPLTRLVVPRRVQRHRAHRLAREMFHIRGLHRTREGTGVMLFVSVLEHHVEIIADHGINAKVGPEDWRQIVDRFTSAVRQGQIGDGFVAAIGSCGELLSRHFPRAADDRNELPDHLIEL